MTLTAPSTAADDTDQLGHGWHAFPADAPRKPGRFVCRIVGADGKPAVELLTWARVPVESAGALVVAHAFVRDAAAPVAEVGVVSWRRIPESWLS